MGVGLLSGLFSHWSLYYLRKKKMADETVFNEQFSVFTNRFFLVHTE